MSTDLSQAIVNGFGIAAKMRDQEMREEGMRLDEAYRRDSLAENTRRFGLEHGLATRKVDEAVKQDARDYDRRVVEFDANKGLEQQRVNLIGRQVDNESKRVAMAREELDYNRMDAHYGAIGGVIADAVAAGEPLDINAVLGRFMADDDTRARAGVAIADDPKFFNAASDGKTPLIPLMTPDGTAFVGSKDGKPIAMTDDRQPGMNGAVTKAPNDLVTQFFASELMKSPSALGAMRRALVVRRVLNEEQAKSASPQEVIKLTGEAAAQSPAGNGRMPRAVKTGLEAIAAEANNPMLTGPARAEADQRARIAFGPPAPEAAGPENAPSLATSSQPSRRARAYQDVYALQNLGLKPDVDTLASLELSGQPSLDLLKLSETSAAARQRASDEAMSKAHANRMTMLDAYLPKGTADTDGFWHKRVGQARADSDLIAETIGEEHFAAKSPLAGAMMQSLANITNRAAVDDSYGEELMRSPELRASAAMAAVQARVNPDSEEFQVAVQRVAERYNTQAMSIPEMVDAINAYMQGGSAR